jgi:hypothetical protein
MYSIKFLKKTQWQCADTLVLFNHECYDGTYYILFSSGEVIGDCETTVQLSNKQCTVSFHLALVQTASTFDFSGINSQFRGLAVFVIITIGHIKFLVQNL